MKALTNHVWFLWSQNPKRARAGAGTELTWEARWEHLPTDKLTIHSILLISAGKRDPATNHRTDDVNQPRQPS